ncbi:MAG: 7-cyano-7-deazaguanine synthase, partial [Planctomycetota bacterium]
MMPTQDTVAIVLTSGGLDSATVLAIAHAEGFQPLPLTFRYGQTHQMEVERAELLVKQMGWKPHLIMDLPFGEVGGSA